MSENPLNVRKWQNKKSKKFVKCVPWMECVEPILSDKDGLGKILGLGDRKFKIGALIQVGFLLENEHNVWFGVNMSAEKQFKDCGEWNKNE